MVTALGKRLALRWAAGALLLILGAGQARAQPMDDAPLLLPDFGEPFEEPPAPVTPAEGPGPVPRSPGDPFAAFGELPGGGSTSRPEDSPRGPAPSEGPTLLIEEFDLNEASVVYSAARKLQLRQDAPAAVHVITDREIRAMGVRSLADVLRTVPGVEVRSWMSGYHNVMIRGMLGSEVVSTRILWLEEGISFNDVRDGGVWLDETFPLDLIKRIEIILGPGSALYGTNAFQGVVNIYYKDAQSIPEEGEYRASYGSFARRTVSATYGRKGDDISLLLHASGGRTDGPGLISDYLAQTTAQQSSYGKGQGCTLAQQDADRLCAGDAASGEACASAQVALLQACGSEGCAAATRSATQTCTAQGISSDACAAARRDAAAMCAVSAQNGVVASRRSWVHLRASGRLDPVRINVGFKHVDADFDGALFFANQYYQFGHEELYANALVSRDVFKSLNLKVVGSLRYFQNAFRDYSDYRQFELLPGGRLFDSLDLFPQDFLQKIDYDIDQYKGSFLVQAQWDVFPEASWGGNEIIAGTGVRYEAIDSPELMVGKRDQAFTNYSVYLQDELSLLQKRLLLTAGGRVDTHNEYAAVVSYRGAALLKPVERLRLRVSAGSAFKEPAMWQLYIDHIDAEGNPELTPERLVNIEGGISWQPVDALELRVDGFATWMRDIIDNQFDPSLAIPELNGLGHPHFGKFHPSQRSQAAFLAGGEVSLRAEIGEAWFLGGSYSYLHTDDGDGNTLPYDYAHKVSLLGMVRRDDARGSVKAHWVSSTIDGEVEVPPYWLVQARVQIDVVGGLALGVDATAVISEGLHDTDRHLAYDEMASVPVPRYVLSTDLAYPF